MSGGWVKFPNTWTDQDDVEDLGSEAAMFHISAVSYSGRQTTDGHIPARALRRLWPVENIERTVQTLLDAGLWETTDTGYYLPEWGVHLLAAAEVEERRRKSAESSERYRRHQSGDHSKCDRCQAVRDQSRDQSRDRSRDRSRDTSVTSPGSARNGSERNGEKRRARDEASHPGPAGSATAPPTTPGLPRSGETPHYGTPETVRIIDTDEDTP